MGGSKSCVLELELRERASFPPKKMRQIVADLIFLLVSIFLFLVQNRFLIGSSCLPKVSGDES